MNIIDGYCHCGLSKYRPIENVKTVMDRFDVTRAVLVQHLGEYDNSYIGSIVAAEPDRFAGVMFVDVDADASALELDGFRGVRLVARTLKTHPHLWKRAAELRLHLVIYDEPSIADHVDALAAFASENPAIAMIVSHLGVLGRDHDDHRGIFDLATLPNVYVQISGMHMFANEPYGDLVPIVERFAKDFGPGRLYYGSNFPVMQHDELYGRELDLIRTGALGVPPDMVEDVLSRTAAKLWFS